MGDITFIVHGEWLENIKELPVEQQDKIIADLVRYGVEVETQHNEPEVASYINMLRGRIDFSKDKYNEKVIMSKKAGRKKSIKDEEIYRLAIQGYKAQEIANILGCSKSSVEHNEGWKLRNKKRNEKILENEFQF